MPTTTVRNRHAGFLSLARRALACGSLALRGSAPHGATPGRACGLRPTFILATPVSYRSRAEHSPAACGRPPPSPRPPSRLAIVMRAGSGARGPCLPKSSYVARSTRPAGVLAAQPRPGLPSGPDGRWFPRWARDGRVSGQRPGAVGRRARILADLVGKLRHRSAAGPDTAALSEHPVRIRIPARAMGGVSGRRRRRG